MPIESLNAVSAMPSALPAVLPTGPTSAPSPSAVTAPDAGEPGSFGSLLAGQVDGLQAMQGERDNLTLRAVTGDLDDVHDATIAAAQASTTMDLMVALRNTGLQAFNELMRIQA